MKTAIVTDSTSDIPENIAEKYNISIIPAILVVNGKSYKDGEGITRKQFYEELPHLTIPPTTATPPLNAFQDVYETLLSSGYTNIISVHVAKSLSGIYNTALLAARTFNNKIHVIDSEQISLGLGFQAIIAAEQAIQGIQVNPILDKISTIQSKIRVFAMLDTVDYLRRSGRVSWAKARISSLLRIKPFIELRKGFVYNVGQVRTRRKGIIRLKSMLDKLGAIERLAVLHSNAESDALGFASDLVNTVSSHPIIVNVTTILGTHVGPNGLGFATVLA
ncbi:MAG TPA: DegV family protein [Anaerolineae bacterium]|nr:DegV family protein [Anaerolineae bacterium]